MTIGLSYALGGIIPLAPYMLAPSVELGLAISSVGTLAALFVFGFVKGKLTGMRPIRGGLQTLSIGGLAAGAAFLLARLIT
jgi:VIT1/CCC1 family predicted Fe2+/Mn2+ transporter